VVSEACVTAVTTVTGLSHIPPLRVAQIVWEACSTLLLCNSAEEDASKSGYSGYRGYREILETARTGRA
jgi:hypothetical protein